MHLKYESQLREPLVYGNKTYAQVTEEIVRPIEAKPSRLWYIGFFHCCYLTYVWCLQCVS